MKYIDEMDLKGKRVLFRFDFNVPLDGNQNITDDTRIRSVLPTINYALDENAKIVIASHLGTAERQVLRNDEPGPRGQASLAPARQERDPDEGRHRA